MHVPDGVINPGVSVLAGGVSAGGLGWAYHRARFALTERLIPLSALLAAFVFTVQLINFPVLPGLSGHLIGGTLTAVLLGPSPAVLVMAIVVTVQALLFADGGLTALGLNLINLSLLAPLGGYWLYRLGSWITPNLAGPSAALAGIAAWLSLPVMVFGFGVAFWLGGTMASLSASSVWGTLMGVHLLVGIVEGIVTYGVVSTLLRIRPDLIHGYLDYRQKTGKVADEQANARLVS